MNKSPQFKIYFKYRYQVLGDTSPDKVVVKINLGQVKVGIYVNVLVAAVSTHQPVGVGVTVVLDASLVPLGFRPPRRAQRRQQSRAQHSSRPHVARETEEPRKFTQLQSARSSSCVPDVCDALPPRALMFGAAESPAPYDVPSDYSMIHNFIYANPLKTLNDSLLRKIM